MKISEVSILNLCSFCKLEYNDLTDDEKTELELIILPGAIADVKAYTGLLDEELDNKPDLTIAMLCIASDMYDHRHYQGEKLEYNQAIKGTLDRHRKNLV